MKIRTRFFYKILLIFPLLLINPLQLKSDNLVIAVYEFNPKSVPASTSNMVTEWVQTAMSNSQYKVVERSSLNKVMKEMELQMSGLTDPENAVKLGKAISANKILSGTVSKIGEKYIIDGRIVDIAKGTSEHGVREFTWKESDLDVCSQRFVDNLILKLSGNVVQKNTALIVPKKDNNKVYDESLEKDRILKTIVTLYDGYINKDIESYLSVIDEKARFWCSAYDLKGKDTIRQYRIKNTFAKLDNFQYELHNINISVYGDTARFEDKYILKYTIGKNGKLYTETANERFDLKKIGNSWYIYENQEY